MEEAGMQEVETYLSRHQNTVAQFIATRPIMDLFLVAERRLGPMISKFWWEQDEVDVEGMGMADQEVERTEGGALDYVPKVKFYTLSSHQFNLYLYPPLPSPPPSVRSTT